MDQIPDTGSSILIQLGIILVLTVINAFFAASEMAIVSSSKSKMRLYSQEGSSSAKKIVEVLEEPTKVLSTIQVAITLAGFLASASAAVGIADDLSAILEPYNIPNVEEISVVLITIALSYFTLVFGELYPKRVAFQHAEKISMGVIGFILVMARILAPFNFILAKSVEFLLFITRQNKHSDEETFSEEEIKSMLEVGEDAGALKKEGKKMIDSVFQFDDTLAYEIMTPRTEVFTIDINDPTSEYLDQLMELKFTRIPVYDDDNDNIIGVLNVKDYIIKAREVGFENVSIHEILRKPLFVPDGKKVDSLFYELQKTRQQIAVLIDEYGGFSGIVTMEDIIEEIFGDIDDEFDDEELGITQVSPNMYTFEGNIDIDDFNEATGLKITSESSETIGGFIIDILEEIPDEGNKDKWEIKFENLIFNIQSVKDRRIEKITLRILDDGNQGSEKTEKEKLSIKKKDRADKEKLDD